MLTHLALVLTLVSQPVFEPVQPENPVCRRIDTAAPLCDLTINLYDAGLKLEKDRDECRIEKNQLEAKLQNHLTPPPPEVVVENEIPTWILIVGSVVVAGAFVGGVVAGLRVAGN